MLTGAIDLPIVHMEHSQKSVRGVHLDLANYLDARRAEALKELEKLRR